MGLSPEYVKWFESYLRNRTFQVKINNVYSSVSNIANGIPQGSPLSPLLFNVFINDLCTRTTYSTPLLYADDLKLIGKIKNYNDKCKMQKDLVQVENWCKTNKMDINTQKTKYITFTQKTNYIVGKYHLKNTEITKVESIKDLGITFDHKLRFNEQVLNIIAQSRKLIGYIFSQWREITQLETYVLLYKTLVRSKLEYAIIIWYSSPCTLR